MELEVRDCIDPAQRERQTHRVQSHKAEFARLLAEYIRARQSELTFNLLC